MAASVGDKEVDVGWGDIVKVGVDNVNFVREMVAIRVGQDGVRVAEDVVGVMVLWIDGGKLVGARDDADGRRVVLGGRGDELGARGGNQPPIGGDGVAADDDLVDAGHEGKDGGVRDQEGLDASRSQCLAEPMAAICGGALGDDHLKLALLGGGEEKGLDGAGAANGHDDFVGVDVFEGLLGEGVRDGLELLDDLIDALDDELLELEAGTRVVGGGCHGLGQQIKHGRVGAPVAMAGGFGGGGGRVAGEGGGGGGRLGLEQFPGQIFVLFPDQMQHSPDDIPHGKLCARCTTPGEWEDDDGDALPTGWAARNRTESSRML